MPNANLFNKFFELGAEYGWGVLLIAFYIYESYKEKKFYQETISKSFEEINDSITDIQHQLNLVLNAGMQAAFNNEDKAQELLKEAIKDKNKKGDTS